MRYDMDGIAVGPDGTIWLTSSYSGSDNDANPDGPLVWALGRPGLYGEEDGVQGGTLVALADGSLLIIGDGVTRFDGQSFMPDDGPTVRPLHDGTLWLIQPDEFMGWVAEGASVQRPSDLLPVIDRGRWISLFDSVRSVLASGWNCVATGDGVEREDQLLSRGVARYLEGTPINQIAKAPNGSIWAVGGYDGENGGL